MNEKPTPETDTNVGEWDEGKFWDHPKGRIVEADFARKLERERNEARAEIAAAKIVLQQPDLPDEPLVVQAKRYVDQHDWQVGVNRGQATQIEKANRENAAMRVAIQEANDALENDYNIVTALAKLQPFIMP
jgi:hypothetical protein